MQKSRVRRVGALLVGLSLVAAACGDDDDEGSDATEAPSEETSAPETTAAAESPETTEAMTDTTAGSETTAGGGGDTAGALAGMKGTTPLVELSDDFKTRLNDFWVEQGNDALVDYNYAAESYDAVVIIALAAQIAGDDGSALANEIVGVTKEGEKCTDFASCLAIVEAGGDIDYDGLSGPLTFNGNGEPLEASYGVLQFGDDNRLDDSLTEFVTASAPASAELPLSEVGVDRAGDGVLKIGTLLPETGSLAFLGPPEFAGVALAVADVNEAGGVLGAPVELSQGDSGDTSTDIASQEADRLLGEGVDAIIGAASSSVTLTVIDKITQAGVVQFSPANTSLALVDYPDNGLYFRNAPPDDLQGSVVAGLVADDGNSSAYILALDDAYGTSLADVVESVLTESGVEVLDKVIYDPEATSFDAEVDAVVDADPDAIVLITFDEGSRILRTMVERGIGPNDKAVYGVDGNMGNALGENFDAGS
jgi:ABC-type branched-subunit amino acid transport system substrate-binding protein